jgi:hypothetical protein
VNNVTKFVQRFFDSVTEAALASSSSKPHTTDFSLDGNFLLSDFGTGNLVACATAQIERAAVPVHESSLRLPIGRGMLEKLLLHELGRTAYLGSRKPCPAARLCVDRSAETRRSVGHELAK